MKNTPAEPTSPVAPTTTDTNVEAAPAAPAPNPTEQAPVESGYITFSGPGEGGEFRDPDGGYRIHLIRDLPVAFGGEARVTASYAQKLVADKQAIYTAAPTN